MLPYSVFVWAASIAITGTASTSTTRKAWDRKA